MRSLVPLAICALLILSCAGTEKALKYGYLPGSDYQFYEPLRPVDLKGKGYNIKVVDSRTSNKISCVEGIIARDTELEGVVGYEYFANYLKAMIEANHGVVDPGAGSPIEIKLTALSGALPGFGYVVVFGYVEFRAVSKGLDKSYCAVMKDGDPDAPVGKWAVDTRRGAFRKIVSGSTRKALEELMHDLAKM
jgi:hypothetical protein